MVFLCWLCGGVFCDGVFCDGVFVVVFLWWCFSGGVCVVVRWGFGGVFVVVLLQRLSSNIAQSSTEVMAVSSNISQSSTEVMAVCKDCHQTSPKVLLK